MRMPASLGACIRNTVRTRASARWAATPTIGSNACSDRGRKRGATVCLNDGIRHVESIEIHHLVPRGHEVAHELLFRVVARVDLRERAEL